MIRVCTYVAGIPARTEMGYPHKRFWSYRKVVIPFGLGVLYQMFERRVPFSSEVSFARTVKPHVRCFCRALEFMLQWPTVRLVVVGCWLTVPPTLLLQCVNLHAAYRGASGEHVSVFWSRTEPKCVMQWRRVWGPRAVARNLLCSHDVVSGRSLPSCADKPGNIRMADQPKTVE